MTRETSMSRSVIVARFLTSPVCRRHTGETDWPWMALPDPERVVRVRVHPVELVFDIGAGGRIARQLVGIEHQCLGAREDPDEVVVVEPSGDPRNERVRRISPWVKLATRLEGEGWVHRVQ